MIIFPIIIIRGRFMQRSTLNKLIIKKLNAKRLKCENYLTELARRGSTNNNECI